MKIIFLDCDGVINPYKVRRDDLVKCEFGRASKSCIEALNHIVNESDAEIVVSSAWRRDERPVALTLKELGVEKSILGVTPHMPHRAVVRGNEIREWLIANESVYGEQHFAFKNYLILDDDSDFLLWQKDHFMKIDGKIGLQKTHTWRATKILAGSL